MSIDLPEAKPDTLEEIFTDKFQYINLDHYNIYHFEELVIDGRRYQFRLSSKGDLMTVVTHIVGRAVLLVSVWTNMDYEKRLKEIHHHILELERSGNVPADFRMKFTSDFLQPSSEDRTVYRICMFCTIPIPIVFFGLSST
ncbi:hypothetical protein CRM22_003988 [Opisthorchis felineus]|uniref:Uncharacterized protein n=1 Tax=Opisthorchis felineus TaxID=147828 RepID=A0A4S2M3M9_OPIFE|nr:hypothetical protein CRM22_003988 [Opisthorchis felineus]